MRRKGAGSTADWVMMAPPKWTVTAERGMIAERPFLGGQFSADTIQPVRHAGYLYSEVPASLAQNQPCRRDINVCYDGVDGCLMRAQAEVTTARHSAKTTFQCRY